MACSTCTSSCSNCTTVTYVDPCTTTTNCTGCVEYYNVECILNPDGTTGETAIQLPSKTTTEILFILNPSQGMVVYNSTLLTVCFYNGTSWRRISETTM